MQEEGLVVKNKRRRKYSSYRGEISPEVTNVLKRNFHADEPNQKWLTDITEFAIPAGKIYLSSILDCFDGMLSGWIERMKRTGLERSMSKKGCSPDNSACEGLFGRIKNNMFYNRYFTGIGIQEFIDTLNDYLIWYNKKELKYHLDI